MDILSGDNLVYTTEIVIPVCDKPYRMTNGFQQMWEDIKICGTMHCPSSSPLGHRRMLLYLKYAKSRGASVDH